MPPEESKPVEPIVDAIDAKLKGKQAEIESESEDDEHTGTAEPAAEAGASSSASKKKKKKKSKRSKAKELLSGKTESDPDAAIQKALHGLTPEQLKELMALNPALAQELASASKSGKPSVEEAATLLKKLNLQEIMTGLAASGRNAKDMGSYKFWQTQPVPKFGEDEKFEEGPLRLQKVEDVPKEPGPLVDGFEWVEMDLTDDAELKEVYELLYGHYVEDDEAMFRFNYSNSILRWYTPLSCQNSSLKLCPYESLT